MSNYIKNAGVKYDTINAMKPDLSPAARVLFIAALMVLPLMLVILQRLDNIKEIRRRQKDGEKILNFREMFNANPPSDRTGRYGCLRQMRRAEPARTGILRRLREQAQPTGEGAGMRLAFNWLPIPLTCLGFLLITGVVTFIFLIKLGE